jgi:valyl-tRNA synthetase
MDEGPQRAVRTTFVNLYRDGLIYRGERMINWCPRCQTALSDLEVEHREQSANLWYVRYPLLDDSDNMTDEHIVIATTRPETIVADVAVAVSPRAERWQKIVGRRALLPIIERPIPIIADDAVDPEFGTGALKITPGHDAVDLEIGERHGLPCIVSVGPDGTMNKEAGPYLGMDRFECRDVIVADLNRLGLLERTEDYHHAIGRCDRCDTIVEPIVSEQWFVRMEPLAKPAIKAVEEGRVEIIPERFARVYMNWMENIRDWCISRQLWWGHRIPVWYCGDCGEITVAIDDPSACEKCGSGKLEQDPDVLDTWFSSALWPHSTLGWPREREDLRYFYPTSVLETGYDILFFWVARMIMTGLYNMRDVPFRHVYLHGLIRDAKGRKMTKSVGNVVDPIKMIDRYGCDALRFVLATGGAPGNDFRLSDDKLEGGRNFANKIWNASRFVIQSIGDETLEAPDPKQRAAMPLEDRWIMSRLQRLISEVGRLLGSFQIGEAGNRLHEFLWSEYADWYIEAAKGRLKAGDNSALPVLACVLDTCLRLLHPFMPFVTEAAWQQLRPHIGWAETDALIVASWPVAEEMWVDGEAERDFEMASLEVVPRVRQALEALSPATAKSTSVAVAPDPKLLRDDRERVTGVLADTATANATFTTTAPWNVMTQIDPDEPGLFGTTGRVRFFVPADLKDIEAQRARLSKQMAEAEGEVNRLEGKLANVQFREKAPEAVVAKEEEKLAAARARLEGLRERLVELG